MRMVIEMMTTYGAAKNWPVGSDIFDGENYTVMEHIKAKGWLQDHIPVWCKDAIKGRGSRSSKKCPPSCFYSSSRDSTTVNLENGLLILSVCFCGTRWINSPSYVGYSNRFETTTICFNRDKIRGEHKCAEVEAERSLQLLHVAADIAPESIARLTLSEL